VELLAGLKRDALAGGGGFLVFCVLGGVVGFLGNGRVAQARVVQPIAFNHSLHVEQEGMECTMCHRGADKAIRSSLPGARACSLCHLEPQGESAAEQQLADLLQEGAPLEWAPLFLQPPHVFFSHRRHVSVAQIECATCHGDIGTSTAPPDQRAPLTMDECIACHEQHAASTDCSACHR
jgi:hypothetical protein